MAAIFSGIFRITVSNMKKRQQNIKYHVVIARVHFAIEMGGDRPQVAGENFNSPKCNLERGAFSAGAELKM